MLAFLLEMLAFKIWHTPKLHSSRRICRSLHGSK